MISNVIVNVLNSAGLGLTKGSSLFAEQGQNDKRVVISTTDELGDPELSFMREAPVGIIVTGWTMAEGSALAERICKTIEAMFGEYTYSNESYDIKSVIIRNWPTVLKADTAITFAANAVLHYKKTTT